jgi:hypothetical protein
MEQIGIFGEFFRAGNEYAIRHFSEADYCDDEVMHFDHKEQLRAYLLNLQKDPTIWTVLNTVARNFGLEPCRTTIDSCDREDLDFLCDKIFSEEWVLIIRKYHGMKSVKLEQCCIKLTQWINQTITATAITSSMSIATQDWKQLAEAINGVNQINRKRISNQAEIHAFEHDKDRKLKQLWKEISDAFA